MSTKTRQEVMAKLAQKHVGAGAEYRVKLIDQVVELAGCHRKSAIRALNKQPRPKKERAQGIKTGRPRECHSDTLPPVLKPIWFAANQPCGCRLRALADRGQHSTCEQIGDIEKSLPFALPGADCDFGCERYDNPQVVELMNALCKGALSANAQPLFPHAQIERKTASGKDNHPPPRPRKKRLRASAPSAASGAENQSQIASRTRHAQPLPARPRNRSAEEKNRSLSASPRLKNQPQTPSQTKPAKTRNEGGRTASAPRPSSFQFLGTIWVTPTFGATSSRFPSSRVTLTFGSLRARAQWV